MNARRRLIAACLLLLAASSVAAAEPDYAREARLAEQTADFIFDGEPVWLEAAGREFLGIHAAADASATAVVLLHGRGFHPNWEDAIKPLRVGLAERGYATLSLQMPVLSKDALYYDYLPIFPYAFPRIEAGLEYLRERGHTRLVLLAHSCGVHMAMAWIAERGDSQIDAFVGLGMGATDYGQPMREPFPLARMRVPVLDLYGSEEFPSVIRTVPERRESIAAAGHPASRQQVLAGADHYFTGHGDPLVDAVAQWLGNLE